MLPPSWARQCFLCTGELESLLKQRTCQELDQIGKALQNDRSGSCCDPTLNELSNGSFRRRQLRLQI
jgi:hypothetical protein